MTDMTILPHALPDALDAHGGAKILSLDCFDTLLWRDCHAPQDLFHLLPGLTRQQRIWAEQHARRSAILRHGRNEATIEEIYAHAFPNADDGARAAGVRAEIDIEARHCFAFAPTVALMRKAKAAGMKVVIVSDTYFSASQLRDLIARAAGEAVTDLIDRIFASSEHGRSKGEGLLGIMLKAMKSKPGRVLHIGDNPNADLKAAQTLGIPALHLVQFSPATVQRLRLEAASGGIVESGRAPFQPHRATLAAGEPAIDDPAAALGYSVLGPVFAPFARWVKAEGETLAQRGGRVHPLFLMRDGHLPHRVFDTLFPDTQSHAIEMSRFTAIAASLDSEARIRRHVEAEIGNGTPAELMKQLLFTEAEIGEAEAGLPSGAKPVRALHRLVLSRERIATTIARARAFGDRLEAYLRREVDLAPGDTLMLIDLGYNGTVQNQVEPVLRERLGVDVAGRYLVLREQDASGLDKAGLIDGSTHDADMLESLAANVAVLEQLCTVSQGSVIDYDDDGEPVRRAASIKGRQSDTREAAQRGCLDYARCDRDAVLRTDDSGCSALERRAAAAVLARLMFLPQSEELAVLERFEHDVNLGGDDVVRLFDRDVAASGLKEQGLFYLKDADRMYLPAELRGHGLPLNLTLFAQRRFGLDLRQADFCDSGVDVPLLLADGRDVTQSSVRAKPTHDGHFVATVPVGAGQFAVGLQFGKAYEWLQIVSARFLPVEYFDSGRDAGPAKPVDAVPTLEGMTQVAPYLFSCEAEGFLMVPPVAEIVGGSPMVLCVAFRPLVERECAPVPVEQATHILATERR
ncbi:HAD family hydrolase [Stakelama sp. CBK3Z-3]|uniref:HAD family hydrolase n=1 Tax=Stakelama flava TaxID=2860338 RepID=A0ABS6XIL0_9SPHN|nr:HAD family hydrolase [Stakelama flava]MBW4330012.1 HAD family hydrolase [Stakelama flava]